MIQRFTAHLQTHFPKDGKWVPFFMQDCVLEMNPRGNLEMVEITVHLPFFEPQTVTLEKGNPHRLVFDREGNCISEICSIKALWKGADARMPKVVGLKNVNPAFPNKYPIKVK